MKLPPPPSICGRASRDTRNWSSIWSECRTQSATTLLSLPLPVMPTTGKLAEMSDTERGLGGHSGFRLDYLSCILTISSTILIGKRHWQGWVVCGQQPGGVLHRLQDRAVRLHPRQSVLHWD